MASLQSATEEEIIVALRQGGRTRREHEELLYRRHVDFVRLRPRKYQLSEEEARDCYTDAFLVVVDHIVSGRFEGRSSLKTYFSRIFRNKCVDAFRKKTTRETNWSETFPELPDESQDFLRQLVGQEELQSLRHRLTQLSARCQELLLLSGQGYSPAELAEKFGFKTPASAASQRYKCLERLKRLVEEVNSPHSRQ